MKFARYLVVLSCLGVVPINAGFLFSKPVWTSRLFRPSHGLAYQVVRDTALAPDGSVWFATWGGGLCHFDGTKWKTINDESHLSDYMIRAVAFDQKGGLWAGTMDGIKYFDGESWTLYTSDTVSSLAEDSVYVILPRKTGEVWFGMTNGYLYSYDPDLPEGSRWRLVRDPESFRNRSIRCLLELDDGSVWVGSDGGFLFDGQKWTDYPYEGTLYSICRLENGTIYGAETESLLRLEGNHWKVVEEGGLQPRSLVATKDGALLVGTVFGLRILENGQGFPFDLSEGATTPYIESLRAFDDGSIWVGTRNGVYLVRQSDWSITLPPPKEIPLTAGRFVCTPELPPTIVGLKGALYRLNGTEWEVIGHLDLKGGTPERIIHYSGDRIVLSTLDSILEYDTTTFSVIRVIPLPVTGEVEVFPSQTFGNYWFRDVRKGTLFRWSDSKWSSIPMGDNPSAKADLFKRTSDGTDWLAFSDRIEAVGKDYPFLSIFAAPRARGHRITDILVSRNGSIWFATSGLGIFVFDGEDMTNYTSLQGLSNDWVFSLYEALDGTIWTVTEDSTVASFKDGRWVTFSREEFQLDGRILQLAEDSTGGIWLLAEPNGLLRYTPFHYPPDTAIDLFPEKVVPHGTAVFSFHGWDRWQATLQEDLVFSWRILEDSGGSEVVPWSPFHPAVTITTPQLKPGTFRFEVRAADKERNIDPTPAQQLFQVESPLYMRLSFWLMIGGAVTIVGFLGSRWLLAHRELLRLARIDGLTGVYKRDYFSQLLEAELRRAVRYRTLPSILLLDLDHFKSINDAYGHDAGDEVLREVARRFHLGCRQVDIVGRWGGEEFIILLPQTDIDQASILAERIRLSIQNKEFTTRQGRLSCTISIGVAQFTDLSLATEELLKVADLALYRAKKNGRNRVESVEANAP